MQEGALHLLGGADEPLARAGELRARRAPVEQLGADRLFERRDAAADRRMVELEPLGGGDELPAARDGEEDADVVPRYPNPWESALSLTREALGSQAPSSVSARSSPSTGGRREHAQDLSERRRKSVTFSIRSAFTRPIFSA